jgi:hypothetical protein
MSKHPRSRIIDRNDVEARLQQVRNLSAPPARTRLSPSAIGLIVGFLALQAVTVLVVLTLVLSPQPDDSDIMAELNVPATIAAVASAPEPPSPPKEAPPRYESVLALPTAAITSAAAVTNSAASAQIMPLKLRGIEITQGIQVFQEPENDRCQPDPASHDNIFCNNSMPMVAGRHTLLRVYVACQERCPTTDTILQLRVIKEGQVGTQLTRSLPLQMLQRVQGLNMPDLRASLDNSINFEFFPPPSWIEGQITFEIAALSSETNQALTTLSLTKEFALRKPLRVAYLPIEYKGLRPSEPEGVDYWLLRMYPVPGVEYYRLPMPDIVWDGEVNKGEILRKLLYTYWYYAQYPAAGSHLPDQLFGWLPQEFYNGGASDPFWCPDCSGPHSSRVAFGGWRPEQDIGGPRILAHEIAHNFGARHAWSPTSQEDTGCFRAEGVDIQVDPEWPYLQEPHIQEFGIDLYSNPPVIYPPSYYDMMAYCTHPWISPHTYRKIFDSPFLKPEADVALTIPPELRPEEKVDQGRTLLVSGVVYQDGTASHPEIIQLEGEALAEAASFIPPAPNSTSGNNYCVRVQARNQTTLAEQCFTVGFADLETGLPTESSSFLIPLPEINPTDVGEITVSRNAQEIAAVKPSNHPPEVKVTFPTGHEALNGKQTFTWEAVDPDGDLLWYDLLYSPDGGLSWLPIAIQLTEPRFTLSTNQLFPSAQALIRVAARDGFHTTNADSGAFTLQALSPNSVSLVGPAVVEPHQTFEITVVAHNVTKPGLFGVQFEVQFDPKLVEVNEIIGHPDLDLVVDRTIQNDLGRLIFVATRRGRADNLTGQLTLATLKLTAKADPGQLSLQLQDVAAGSRGGLPLNLSTTQGLLLHIEAPK